MKSILFFLTFLLFFLVSQGQSTNPVPRDISVQNDYRVISQYLEKLRLDIIAHPEYFKTSIVGDLFLQKDWEKGFVNMIDGQKIPYTMMYNVYQELFWIKKETEVKTLIFTNEVKEIELGEKKFIYQLYATENENKGGVMEILTNGEIKLLKHYTSKFIAGRAQTSGYENKEPDKFITRETYYYLNSDEGIAREFPTKKEEIYTIFGSKKNEIADYVKKNKLKLKKEKDLICLFDYYNTLR